jgi:hypothetical protein
MRATYKEESGQEDQGDTSDVNGDIDLMLMLVLQFSNVHGEDGMELAGLWWYDPYCKRSSVHVHTG